MIRERRRWVLRSDPPTGLPDAELSVFAGWTDLRVGVMVERSPSETLVVVQAGPVALHAWWRPLALWRAIEGVTLVYPYARRPENVVDDLAERRRRRG